MADRITIKTFHAFGLQLLREHGEAIGLRPDFTLCTEEDRGTVLRQARPDLRQADADKLLAGISRGQKPPARTGGAGAGGG